ncbi:SDR family oxidoreductase [Candidatus Pelagibacter sp.]|nr:SDR family oxidoreductase [Candidatus Pelagibacter sp.]
MKQTYLNKFSLKNNIAYIIGGNGIIGKEVVKYFCEAYAKVIILDQKKDDLFLKKLKYKYDISFKKFDVSNLNKIEKNLLKIFKNYGEPNILINCSYPKDKNWIKNTFSEINLSSFKKNIEINLVSSAWISRIFAERMKKNTQENMSIIHLGSIYGLVGQDPNLYQNSNINENLTYSIIKGGITNYSKQMASYYGKFNIRINTIAPGGIEGKISGKKINQNSVFKRNYIKKNPIKRFCTPQDVAAAAIYLASESSSYVTGSTLVVDGGWTII